MISQRRDADDAWLGATRAPLTVAPTIDIAFIMQKLSNSRAPNSASEVHFNLSLNRILKLTFINPKKGL